MRRCLTEVLDRLVGIEGFCQGCIYMFMFIIRGRDLASEMGITNTDSN